MSETETVQAGEVEITREQLLGQIAEIDGNAPASDTASTPTSDNAAEEPTSETVNVEDKPKEEAPEPKEQVEPSEEQPKSKYSRAKKAQDRANKSWKEVNAAKEELKQEQAKLAADRQELEAKKTDAFSDIQQRKEAAKFSPDDYEQIAQEYREEGRDDLAELALQKAKTAKETIQQQEVLNAQRTVMEQWEANLSQQVKDNPSLQDQDSELYKFTSELLDRKKILATYPEGINDAVEAAKQFIKAKRVDNLEAENSKLAKQVEELNGKLQINGTTVDQSGRLESFSNMSADRQRDELLKMVKDHDQRGAVINL
jgi:predicted  nucleic acid-binding Zn-ribbon protein